VGDFNLRRIGCLHVAVLCKFLIFFITLTRPICGSCLNIPVLHKLLFAFVFSVGTDVVIVKNGHRICGSGAALGNAPLVQNKAYFEVKIQQTGKSILSLNAQSDRCNNCQNFDALLRIEHI
jgi:hypothetical protein